MAIERPPFKQITSFFEKFVLCCRPLTQRLSLSFSRSDVYSFTYLQQIAALTLRSYFAFSRSRVAMPIVAANPGINSNFHAGAK
jgi:hypothetical protein